MIIAAKLDSKDVRARHRWERVVFVAALFVAGVAFLRLACYPLSFANKSDGVIAAPIHRVPPTISATGESVVLLNYADDLVRLVVRPLVIQVGGLMLFQAIGMPLAHQLLPILQTGKRLLLKQQIWTRLVLVSSQASRFARVLPKTLQNVPRFVAKLFRKRSRLSVASEFTNFIGNEEEE